MKRVLAICLVGAIGVGCAPAASTPPLSTATAAVVVSRPTTVVSVTFASPASTPAFAATSVPVPTTAMPVPTLAVPTIATGPDYPALRASLLPPLGGLIVATREKSPQTPAFRAAFNAAGAKVLEAIEGDMSVNGNRLHSVVVNTQEAASRGDLAELERQRLELLKVPGS